MRLFVALNAAMGFVVMGADCTNAYGQFQSSTQATSSRLVTPTGITLAMERFDRSLV
jgi:hypothetical protein